MNNLKLKVTKKDSPKGAPTEAPNGEAVTDKTSHLAPKTKKRTRGLWLFDAALYFFSNAVVFAISVVATYFTEQGGVRRAPDGTLLKPTAENPLTKKDGELVYGRFANWMSLRGTNLDNVLINDLKMSREGAEMTRMVFFSFFDGTLAAPLVKLAEDRREKIARWLDEKMGTLPADESVYAEEPKQSWKSVIMGRFATALVVVPTAVALSKIGTKDDKWIWNTEKENLGFSSLNDKLFNTPGLEAGKRLEKSDSDFAKKLGSKITNVPYLTKTIAFEAFYTSVCTAGLYFSSRFIARLTGKKDEPAKPEATETPARHARNTTPAAQGEAAHGDTAPTPKASENLKSAPRKAPAATTFGGRYEVAAAEAPSLVKAL